MSGHMSSLEDEVVQTPPKKDCTSLHEVLFHKLNEFCLLDIACSGQPSGSTCSTATVESHMKLPQMLAWPHMPLVRCIEQNLIEHLPVPQIRLDKVPSATQGSKNWAAEFRCICCQSPVWTFLWLLVIYPIHWSRPKFIDHNPIYIIYNVFQCYQKQEKCYWIPGLCWVISDIYW